MADHEHDDFTEHGKSDFRDRSGQRIPVTEQRSDQASPTKAYPREESHEYDPNADGGPDNPSDPATYPDPQKQGPETSREQPPFDDELSDFDQD